MSNPVELVLTCGSWQEAQKIADSLLEQKLIACVEMLDVTSRFAWKQSIEENKEVKLIMTTAEHLYDHIETEVKKLHSYETFVLQQIPITHLNQAAHDWLAEVTKN
ncbi:divalent-cation tolerance protein CutA [Candidatus Saccharibacteria bacterium]|nr:divalent-cation tolerance protein CutA [Candidatus Saccharibacteria bacterium]